MIAASERIGIRTDTVVVDDRQVPDAMKAARM